MSNFRSEIAYCLPLTGGWKVAISFVFLTMVCGCGMLMLLTVLFYDTIKEINNLIYLPLTLLGIIMALFCPIGFPVKNDWKNNHLRWFRSYWDRNVRGYWAKISVGTGEQAMIVGVILRREQTQPRFYTTESLFLLKLGGWFNRQPSGYYLHSGLDRKIQYSWNLNMSILPTGRFIYVSLPGSSFPITLENAALVCDIALKRGSSNDFGAILSYVLQQYRETR
ncbi:hypothetical protein KJ782_04555, partial [Patescibacteria group bacterium]|nr:hypothetical protein [Patescibacteria group bacterium]